jgi:hypothetical protein
MRGQWRNLKSIVLRKLRMILDWSPLTIAAIRNLGKV